MDGLNSRAVVRYAFRSSKDLWQSSVHSNAFLRILKNGKHLSMALETNLLRAATHPMSDWTSLIFCGGFISSITWILLRLALISLCETIKPRNFPDDTPKAHLLGFNFMLYYRNVSNVSCRSSR